MNNMLYKFGFKKVGLVLGLSLVMVFAATLAILPRETTVSRASGCDAYDAPIFNPFPVRLNGDLNSDPNGPCEDAPVLSGGNHGGSWAYSVNAQAGEDISMRIWAHNGAAINSGAVMHGVNITTSISSSPDGTTHTVTTNLTANNAASKSGSVTIYTPAGSSLQLIAGQKDIYLGDIQPCFDFARVFTFTLRVVAPVAVQSQVNLNLDKSDYCVGEYATYTVNGSANLAGQSIFWSSTLNGDSTGEDKTYYGHVLNGQGSFTERSSQPWNSSHIGSWTKTATVGGVSSSASFTVRSCATAQPSVLSFNVNPPTCTSNNAQVSWSTQNFDNIEVKVNGTVLSGNDSGTESVNWLVPGYTYAFTFWNNGSLVDTKSYTVPTLSCGGGTEPVLSCRLSNSNPSTLFVGDSAQFVATGGNNQFSWFSEGNPNSGSGTIYETAFATAGNKTVTVQSGNQTVTCYANIVARTQAANLTCTPGNVTLDINQSQTFTSNGGEGTEIWTVDDVTVSQAFASINRSFSTSGQHYVTVRKGAQQATCNVNVRTPVIPNPVIPNPVTPNNPVCPAGSVFLSPNVINQGESATASAPSGWYGGRFVSSNTNVVTVSGSTITATYISIGSTTVTGEGWTAPNGATNCSLGWSGITVQRPQASNACVQRTFNTNSGVYANGGKASSLKPNETFQVACDYGVVSGYITLDGNGAQGCNFSGWDHTGAIFDCKAPSAAGTYNVSCRISNNAQADNSCSSTNPVNSYTVTQATQPSVFTATATATASASASAYCVDGTSATASASATATATATGSTQSEAQINAQNKANDQAKADANASAHASAQAKCTNTPPPTNFSASATATATASASAVCSDGSSATASASSSATATANSTVSQQVAYNSAFTQAQNQAQSQAQAQAYASAQAKCPNLPPPPVCYANINTSLNATLPVASGNLYRTTISYNWTGSNAMKVTYIDPNEGQEKVFVQNAVKGSSQDFSNIEANKNYIFKIYDTSSCGGVLSSIVVRKDVEQACVSNSNYALNASTPVKQGNTYSVTLTWTTTGSHSIKLAQNTLSNVINTGNSTGQFIITGLSAGSSHSFYILDATCGNALTSVSVQMPTEQTTSTGNCNNSDASCNTNTNTNTGTNTNSTNSSNQGNNSNINGNNNTVTQANQNCVNNSCNTVYYIAGGNTVPANEYRQLSIEKLVRNTSGNYNSSYQNSVSANINDTVEFQIVVKNTGNQTVNNVRLSDILPNGLSYVSGQLNSEINLGSMSVNESRTVTFQARIVSNSGSSIQNIARVNGDSVSQIQDDAWVFINNTGCTYNCVQGGSVNLVYSKRAVNETKTTSFGNPVDATTVNASREDYITYTLTVTNNGNSPANSFVITDDLSQVLPYADMVDNGGGNLNGNVISFPGITVPAGGAVSKSFKVRVKYGLESNLTYTMSNTYGNTVTIRINNPQVKGIFVAPQTGADTSGFVFAGMLTAAFAVFRKKDLLIKLVLNS